MTVTIKMFNDNQGRTGSVESDEATGAQLVSGYDGCVWLMMPNTVPVDVAEGSVLDTGQRTQLARFDANLFNEADGAASITTVQLADGRLVA